MKKGFVLMFAVALAFVLESKVTVMGVAPNLTVLLVYFVGLRGGERRGLLFGALIGAISDSLAGNILGPAFIGKATAGYIAPRLTKGFFRWMPVLGVFALASVAVVDGAIEFFALTMFDDMPASLGRAVVIVLSQAAMVAAAGLFIKPKDEK